MAKRSPFPRKPASKRPPNQDRGVGSPLGLDFAIKFQMLTDEEITALREGNAALSKGGELLNLNAALTFPTGVAQKIYAGRRLDILADRLLGLDQED